MKYLLTITLTLSSLTVAQELPGWGEYLGGGLGGVTVENEPDGWTFGQEPIFPFIGVSKGMMLGVPLVVSVGLGKRGFNGIVGEGSTEITIAETSDWIDVAAYMPYPVGPGFAQIGFLYGNPLNTGKQTYELNGEEVSELSGDAEDLDFDADMGLIFAYGYPITEQININAGYYLGIADHGDDDGAVNFNGMFLFLGYNF